MLGVALCEGSLLPQGDAQRYCGISIVQVPLIRSRAGPVLQLTAMKTLEELKQELLVECRDDEVGLWSIIWCLRNELGMEDPAEIRSVTLQMVRELLETGTVVAGWYAPADSGLPVWQIVPWPGSIDDILARINQEWDQLGREPNIGNIVILQEKS